MVPKSDASGEFGVDVHVVMIVERKSALEVGRNVGSMVKLDQFWPLVCQRTSSRMGECDLDHRYMRSCKIEDSIATISLAQ